MTFFCQEDSSILSAGDMSFHIVIQEGLSEEVSAHTDNIGNMNSGANSYKTLGNLHVHTLKKVSLNHLVLSLQYQQQLLAPSKIQCLVKPCSCAQFAPVCRFACTRVQICLHPCSNLLAPVCKFASGCNFTLPLASRSYVNKLCPYVNRFYKKLLPSYAVEGKFAVICSK